MMKNKILFFLVLGFIGFSGCRKLTEFTINNSTSFVVPQTAAIGIPSPTTMAVSSSSSFEFQNNHTDSKHIKEVKLNKLTLTITQPEGEDFSFLNSIHIYISAAGVSEVELAYLDNIPATAGNSIDLTTTGALLNEYVKKDQYQLRVETVTNELLSQDITVKADMDFFVKAKVL